MEIAYKGKFDTKKVGTKIAWKHIKKLAWKLPWKPDQKLFLSWYKNCLHLIVGG